MVPRIRLINIEKYTVSVINESLMAKTKCQKWQNSFYALQEFDAQFKEQSDSH